MEFLYPVLSGMDKRLLLGLAAVLCVIAVVACVKRVFKVAVALLCLAAVFMLLRPAVDMALDKYGIVLDANKKTVTMTVDGKPYNLKIDELQYAMKDPRTKIEFVRQEASTTIVLKYYKKDGNVINERVPVPDFMLEPLQDIFDKAGIVYKYAEYKQ